MKHIFQTYQKKLTNLSTSNRSLFLPRSSSLNDLDLHEVDYLEKKASFSHIAALIEGKSPLVLCKKNDARNEATTKVSNRLKTILRRSDFITEERGVHDLYIGWPFVQGLFNDGTPVRCPLLLWPVTISQTQHDWVLLPEADGMVFNRSFLLAYTHYNNHKVAEELIETFETDHSNDPLVFRTELFELLKNIGLELRFNRDTFIDKLSYFQEFKRADFTALFQLGELKLMPEAVLGIFPSFGSFLAPDYDFLIDNCEGEVLEDFFVNRTTMMSQPQEENYIHEVLEEQVITPFAIDIFQENILKSVKKGHSVVVQGPPGTGKSQLIANLTADYIARGKKVLVVCEKRVALEVVYERFKEIGIHDFIALIHDPAHDRSSLYQKMALLIQQFDEHKRNTQNINALRIEQQFTETSRRISQITLELDAFRDAWYNEVDFGIAPSELVLSANYNSPFLNVSNYIKEVDFHNIRSFEQKLNHFVFYAQKLPKSSFWNARINFANQPQSFKIELLEALKNIGTQYKTIVASIGFEFLPNSSKEFLSILAFENLLTDIKTTLDDETVLTVFKALSLYKKDLQLLLKHKTKFESKIDAKSLKLGAENDLEKVEAMVQYAQVQYLSFFNKTTYQLFHKEYKSLKELLVTNQLTNTPEGLLELQKLIVDAKENIKAIEEIVAIKGVSLLELENHDVQQVLTFINHLIKLFELKKALKETIISEAMLGETLAQTHANIDNLLANALSWEQLYTKYREYLSDEQLEFLITIKQEDTAEIESAIVTHFDTYQAFDDLLATFKVSEIALAYLFLNHETNMSEINPLLHNSFAIAWKEALELQYPLLKLYHSDRFNLLSTELKQLVATKTVLSKQVLQLRLQENIHKHVEYNRLSNRVTYRDLLHQVTKRKKIWPVRKLIASLSEDIFKILPCWLASPETVSAVFPMEQYFDLVIFDEASQCFAEKGIPAIYRAKQIVVTGDSQQLSPNDLYKVRWSEEEDDDTPELGYDSLLDLCGRYFKSLLLKQHYRSNHPALIAFSNEHFYHNALIFANKGIQNEAINPIEFRFIANAVWKNRTNQLEAQEVIHLIKEIQMSQPGKSIGVVTFNYHQQELIYSLIQEGVGAGYLQNDERLIVKNIENIQGDERDVIIFSVGYAPDEKGKLQMNFGSLSAENGEKRLNVAITRAKDKVYILSSITPDKLLVENTLNEGPKLFKKYLEQVKNNTISTQNTIRTYEWFECLSMKYHVTL